VRCSRLGLGLSWDRGGCSVDADLQGVAFSATGQLVDAVYYNNMKALGGGLTHSGDETTGEKAGLDEAIWVNFQRLPADTKVIVIVVACYKGGHLRDLQNGKLHMLENDPDNDVAQWSCERSEEEVDVLGLLHKHEDGSWWYRQIDLPAADGQHFIDILEPTIGTCVRSIIPSAPKRLKACFAMDKGSLVDLPKTQEIKKIRVGLGWDTGDSNVDLDVSAVLLSHDAKEHATVFFGNLTAPGVRHSGDNLTGEGSGDDEMIDVTLDQLEQPVQQIIFLVNIYTKGKSFSLVRRPYSRVSTELGGELARYQLSDAGSDSGLLVARLLRAPDGVRWSFQAIGRPCSGRTYKDSMRWVQEVAVKTPTELQLRTLSSECLNGTAEVGAEDTVGPPPTSKACCVL